MEIRHLNEGDIEQFRELLLYSLRESPKAFSDSPEEISSLDDQYFKSRLMIVGDPPESFVLGALDPNLVGMLTYRRDQRIKARHKSSVYSMYVHPELRGTGLGAQLMNEMILQAKKLPGLEQIHVWVMNSEQSARDFYLKFGFESTGLVRQDLVVNGQHVDSEYLVLYL